MGLEVGTWITDLNIANPLDADAESFGAAHFRLVKSVLQNTLPHGDRATDLSLLNNVAALCVLANPTNGLAAAQALVAAVDGGVLRRSGAALGFGAIDLTNIAAVSNPIAYFKNAATQAINTTVYTDVTGHTAIPLVTGATYELEAYHEYITSGAAGIATRMQFTNAPQNQGGLVTLATEGTQGISMEAALDDPSAWFNYSTPTNGVRVGTHWRGRIFANATTGGTMKLQTRCLAGSTTLTVQIGSYTKLTRIS